MFPHTQHAPSRYQHTNNPAEQPRQMQTHVQNRGQAEQNLRAVNAQRENQKAAQESEMEHTLVEDSATLASVLRGGGTHAVAALPTAPFSEKGIAKKELTSGDKKARNLLKKQRNALPVATISEKGTVRKPLTPGERKTMNLLKKQNKEVAKQKEADNKEREKNGMKQEIRRQKNVRKRQNRKQKRAEKTNQKRSNGNVSVPVPALDVITNSPSIAETTQIHAKTEHLSKPHFLEIISHKHPQSQADIDNQENVLFTIFDPGPKVDVYYKNNIEF